MTSDPIGGGQSRFEGAEEDVKHRYPGRRAGDVTLGCTQHTREAPALEKWGRGEISTGTEVSHGTRSTNHNGTPFIHISEPIGDVKGDAQAVPSKRHHWTGDGVESPFNVPRGGVNRSNPVGQCVFNKNVDGKQYSICVNVKDLLVSCELDKVIDSLRELMKKNKVDEIQRGTFATSSQRSE